MTAATLAHPAADDEYGAFLTRLTGSNDLVVREQAYAELVKRPSYPGQRYRHGWIPVGPDGKDLAAADAPPVVRAPRKRPPLTDRGFETRRKRVARVIAEAVPLLATDVTHSQDGAWEPERDALHRQIATDLYAQAAHVPTDGRAVIAGGLGGAGKSTVLRDHAGIVAGDYLTINPDDIKEEMASRGLIPEIPGHPDLSPMERAALVHEESSRIAALLADMAYRDKRNMIWDITMFSQKAIDTRIRDLRRHGYTNIEGVFVDIPVEVSVKRALSRYREGVDDYRSGKGPGGRYVPPEIIRAQKTRGGRTFNREAFDATRDASFTRWSVYDNSRNGKPPRLVEKKGAKP